MSGVKAEEPEVGEVEEPEVTDEEEIDDDDVSETFAQFWETLTDQAEEIEKHGKRIESMDRTLFFGLRGMVMLIDNLERAVNPLSEPDQKAEALTKVREIIGMMRETLK